MNTVRKQPCPSSAAATGVDGARLGAWKTRSRVGFGRVAAPRFPAANLVKSHTKPKNRLNAGLAAASPHHHPGLGFTDEHWIPLGVQRVREDVASGRAFLQKHGPRFDAALSIAHSPQSLSEKDIIPNKSGLLQEKAC
jgi:hypothetical protein